MKEPEGKGAVWALTGAQLKALAKAVARKAPARRKGSLIIKVAP
jgi:hypothetical protein